MCFLLTVASVNPQERMDGWRFPWELCVSSCLLQGPGPFQGWAECRPPWGGGGHRDSSNNSVDPQWACWRGHHEDDKQRLTCTHHEGKHASVTDGWPGASLPLVPARGQPAQGTHQPPLHFPGFLVRVSEGRPLEDEILLFLNFLVFSLSHSVQLDSFLDVGFLHVLLK